MCGLCAELCFDGSLPDLTALTRVLDKLARQQSHCSPSHPLACFGLTQARRYVDALAVGAAIEKPPRTTRNGAPLHELRLKHPNGNLSEISTRVCLTQNQQANQPPRRRPFWRRERNRIDPGNHLHFPPAR